MNESTPERKESPRRIIEGSLTRFFYDLKEHMHALGPQDYDALSQRFVSEVNSYVGEFLKRIEASREVRRQRLERRG